MAELDMTSAPVHAGEGTAPAMGQAPASTPPPSGQPASSGTPQPEQPTGETGRGLWKDLPSAERDYKALQAEYTRLTQGLSRLKPYGDITSISERLAQVEQLRQHPEFQTWVQGQIAKAQTGSQDPDTLRALQLIDQIADEKVRTALAPIEAERVQARMKDTFAAMDQKHGPEWQAARPAMKAYLEAQIARGIISPAVDRSFDLPFVESLYFAVAAQDPNFGASQYQKRLEAKRQASISASPGTAPSAIGGGKIGSIDEAFAAAKRQHHLA